MRPRPLIAIAVLAVLLVLAAVLGLLAGDPKGLHWPESEELLGLEELIPSPDAGPEALYIRGVLLEELELALGELPKEQREVFVAHELEGRSFREMSASTGVSVNTLLSRKRYAVLHLRERLQSIYDELTGA